MVHTKKHPSKIVSIEDVALQAGVSITTVSRVINKLPTVKENNRIKVLEVIKELNFQPSVYAQRLASGKSNVVMLVIPRYEGIFYSFYVLELIRGIGTLCDALKLDLMLHLTDARSPLNLKGTGGVIFADIIGNQHQLEEALKQGVACVVINNIVDDLKVDCIACDNLQGARQAVNYLISLGHRKIAHISGDLVIQAAAQRLLGYRQALEENDITVNEEYIFKTDYSRGQARIATEKMLCMQDPVTAVFVSSDSMALEVMAVAREMDKDIPQQLSIVGFDDNPSGLYGSVALTTVNQPLIKMAQDGIKKLNSLMSGDKSEKQEKILLATELVIRESCHSLTAQR